MNICDGFTPFSEYTFSKTFEEIIMRHGTKLKLPAHKTLVAPYEEPYFYYIFEGRIRVSLFSVGGEEKILAIINSPAFEGVTQLLTGVNDITHISTEIPSTVYRLDKDTFWKLFRSPSIFNEIIAKDVAKMVERSNRLIEAYSFKSCKQRLYDLLKASIDVDSLSNGWYKLTLQYTQHEMAKIIGATRVTVAKFIRELRDDDLIRIINNNIEVKSNNT
jgi:CRP-like cAMP-binding protein